MLEKQIQVITVLSDQQNNVKIKPIIILIRLFEH